MLNDAGRITGTGRVTGKGQVQVPKEIREALGIRVGDELVFQLSGDQLTVRLRKRRRLSELAGVLPSRHPFPGIQEEEEGTKRAVAAKIARRRRNGR
ncbi:AbrB/MazE/SpoVT family DNA-binding domain-containing protein [Thermodesulfitimonas sp.]